MKRIIATNPSVTSSTLLLVLRIGVAALMLTHGVPKMMLLFAGGPVPFPPLLGLTPETALLLTVGAEVVCSLLLLAGAATRLAVLPLIITMLVAVFLIHGTDPFAKKELAVMYLLIYTALGIGGSGKYSLDYLLQRNKTAANKGVGETEDPTLFIYQ